VPELLRRAGRQQRDQEGKRADGVRDDRGRQRRAVADRVQPADGDRTITAVTAYELSGDLRTLYATALGPTARALYLRASA
jgi:hypothetical protein